MQQPRKNIKKNTRFVSEQNRLRRIANDSDLQVYIDVETAIELFAQNPEINNSELKALLKRANFEVDDRIVNEVKLSKCDFQTFLSVIKEIKEKQIASEQSNEILNAFVALGGNFDRSGKVQKSMLVNIIKNQFELTFDIEEFLDKTTEGSELDYNTFACIFQQTFEEGGQSLSDRFESINTKMSTVPTAQVGEEGATTRIYYNEFENWLEGHK